MTGMLLLLALLLLGAWLLLRLRRASSGSKTDQAPLRPFAAVSIRGTDKACCRAKALAGERFLARKPPELPLAGCDADTCECYFVHYDDRRHERDRRSPFNVNTGSTGTGVFEAERRQGIDRRKASRPA
ncbi:MAG: hypothetical protein AAF660_13740 [Pseudomonadota bacterium]